jgi:hypothetical protein
MAFAGDGIRATDVERAKLADRDLSRYLVESFSALILSHAA